jgi:hypothetical protein
MFWWFTDNGLSPYWALATIMQLFDEGWHEFDIELWDGPWHVRFNYNADTGIAPRESDDVGGDRMYEFKIHADGPGEKKADFVISPRWDDQRKPDGDRMQRPWCGGEGLDVHVQGSNLTFDEYHYLLQKCAAATAEAAGTDWNPRYFNRIRPDSNIATVELYVRLMRQYATQLVDSTGAFYRIMHLLASQEGTQWVYKGDNTEIVGKRHAFDLDPQAASELIDDHSLGKRPKCYHPKHVRSQETRDDPLSSPKFGVAFHSSLNTSEAFGQQWSGGGTSVKWRDRDRLLRELEETLINVLRWAGVPIDPTETVFVADDHFDVEASERSIGYFDDPTPDLEFEQENAVLRVMQDLSPSARDVMKTLATDGGEVDGEGVHYSELADETGYSVSQIYRALEEVGEIVVNDNGLVRYYSEKIREEIVAIVERVESFVGDGIESVARLAGVETRSAADSAIQRWMDTYGASFDHDDETIRFDTLLSELRSGPGTYLYDVLEEGLLAWKRAGRDAAIFANLAFEADEIIGRASPSGTVGSEITW